MRSLFFLFWFFSIVGSLISTNGFFNEIQAMNFMFFHIISMFTIFLFIFLKSPEFKEFFDNDALIHYQLEIESKFFKTILLNFSFLFILTFITAFIFNIDFLISYEILTFLNSIFFIDKKIYVIERCYKLKEEY